MDADLGPDAGIYARKSEYLERYVQLGIASGQLISVSFPEKSEGEGDHELLERVFAYLEGERDDFDDVAVALTVPTTQRRVLEQVRKVPYGTQITVRELAGMTPDLDRESDDDLQTVRVALDANPTPLVIPDHRVRDGPSAAPPAVEQRLRSLEGL